MAPMPQWLNIRPVHQWPGALTTNRKRSPFSAKWGTTAEDLRRELRHLGADGVPAKLITEVAVREEDIRRDRAGLLAGRTPAHPGVILNIESARVGKLAYPCDTFTTWEDNVRAITLSLEWLRGMARYGVGETRQWYAGFAQLEGAPVPVEDQLNSLRILIGDPDRIRPDLTAKQLVRLARVATHPDRNDGNRTAADAVDVIARQLTAAGVEV